MSPGGQGRVLAVIPARLASQRLPGKVLAGIAGRPMVEHVWRRLALARRVDDIVVATDDPRVVQAVVAFGGSAVLTSPHHPTGSDRVWEVASGVAHGLVLNVQGDEPLLDPEVVDALVGALDDPTVQVATVAGPLTEPPGTPSVVKVVTDLAGNALYFSRSPVPVGGPWLHHIGIYGWRREALARFASRAPTPLERAERLEQLRCLEYGDRVRVLRVAVASASVDTPEDLERVRRVLEASDGR